MHRLLFLLVGLVACSAGLAAQPITQAGFVTRLGADTLAVERFSHTPSGMEATVVLRAPRTTVTTYRLDLDDDGGLRRYEATTREPTSGAVTRREAAEAVGDSLRVTVTSGGERQTRTFAAPEQNVPFVDMVHWPFEVVAQRALAAGGPLDQPLFTERGLVAFTTDVTGERALTITHPFRGTMDVTTDAGGRLLTLDAGATTRKLTVQRVEDVDVEAAARRFAALDAGGQSFGALSGRAETTASIGGATISVDHGQPSKRGREVWGALVPWGEVWRTGANRATHLTTDRDLVLGGLAVPAGTYTLYSVPQPDGGLLIVNRQTGQGGTTYNADQDLGRVALTRSALDETVEDFAIAIEPTSETAGRLVLRWDRDAFSVPVTVE